MSQARPSTRCNQSITQYTSHYVATTLDLANSVSQQQAKVDWNRCRHRTLVIRVYGKASSRPRVLPSGKVESR
eukprot:5325906-Pleurochrysis_carterae.AAC.1